MEPHNLKPVWSNFEGPDIMNVNPIRFPTVRRFVLAFPVVAVFVPVVAHGLHRA